MPALRLWSPDAAGTAGAPDTFRPFASDNDQEPPAVPGHALNQAPGAEAPSSEPALPTMYGA
jgi:hypothetical protein